jgi:hypothetical protein
VWHALGVRASTRAKYVVHSCGYRVDPQRPSIRDSISPHKLSAEIRKASSKHNSKVFPAHEGPLGRSTEP